MITNNWFRCCRDLDAVNTRFEVLINSSLPQKWIDEIIDQFNRIMESNKL